MEKGKGERYLLSLASPGDRHQVNLREGNKWMEGKINHKKGRDGGGTSGVGTLMQILSNLIFFRGFLGSFF